MIKIYNSGNSIVIDTNLENKYIFSGSEVEFKVDKELKTLNISNNKNHIITIGFDDLEISGIIPMLDDIDSLLGDLFKKGGSTPLPTSTNWGEINGNINNQEDLINKINQRINQNKELLFIDLWKTLCTDRYGGYNDSTKFYELNGITDITYEEAKLIYQVSSSLKITDWAQTLSLNGIHIRTLPPLISSYNSGVNYGLTNTFESDSIEILNLFSQSTNQSWFGLIGSIGTNTFKMPKLKKIIGNIRLVGSNATIAGINVLVAPLLEEMRLNISGVSFTSTRTFDLQYLGNLDLASWTYTINSYTNATALVFKVHTNIYSKLNDAVGYPQWNALLNTALTKNITFAV